MSAEQATPELTSDEQAPPEQMSVEQATRMHDAFGTSFKEEDEDEEGARRRMGVSSS
jgi:hypothetical protein